MDITKLNLTQLKALGYEQMILLNQTQLNLNLINAEIEKRKQEEPINIDNAPDIDTSPEQTAK